MFVFLRDVKQARASLGTLQLMRSLTSLLVLILALSLPAAAARAAVPDVIAGQPLPSLAPMLESATPAVVNISTVAARRADNALMQDPFFRRFFEQQPQRESRPQSLGSGVVVDAAAGIVITNDHVIDGAARIVVTLSDGRELDAELLGTDPDADIAVLRVEAVELVELPWADSDALRVGDFCVAIGNPFGLGQTVTSGIVSALGRSGLGIEAFEDFIQTDASINPGNSGGALISLDGQLIGINTAIVGPSGGNIGIGFAIPSNLARHLVAQIVETGRVRRGALGVSAQAIDERLSEAFGIDRGVVVGRIQDESPAARAGLRIGDVIVAVDERRIDDVAALRNRVGLVRLGQRLRLSIVREGKPRELDVTVDVLPAAHPLLQGTVFADRATRNGRRYVTLERIEPGSVAERAGLRTDDAVLGIDGTPVATVEQLEAAAARLDDDSEELVLLVQRGRQTSYVRLSDG